MARTAANLAGWLNEPVVQDAVAAAVRQSGEPLLMREVAILCDLPARAANRALSRLWKKGLINRYKLPMQRHAYCHRRGECIPGGATRMLYVYAWVAWVIDGE